MILDHFKRSGPGFRKGLPMPNSHPYRTWLTSPRRLARVAALGAVLQASAGCQKLPLRYSEIEALATNRPTTVVDPASEPASSASSPREVTPPIVTPTPTPPADPTAKAIPDAVEDAKPAPGAITATQATPLLDAAVARVEGLAPTPPLEIETPAESGPVELPVISDAPPTPAPKSVDTPAGPASSPAPIEPAPSPTTEKKTEVAPPPTEAVAKPPAPVVPDAPKKEDSPTAKTAPEATSKPINPDIPAEPVATLPRDEWGDSLSRLRALARQHAGEPGDAAEAWGIRSHVLDWLAGKSDDPRDPTGPSWNRVLAALSTATSTGTVDESALAHHLSAAVDTLESYTPMQIRVLTLCRKVDGYGRYESLESPNIHVGKPFLIYCELDGLRYEENEEGFRSRLSSRVEVVPTSGGAPVWSEAHPTAEDLCRRRRRDYYANYRVVLPPTIPPGEYALRLTQTDLLSGKSVASSVDLHVSP
jgi:hypothetical protein